MPESDTDLVWIHRRDGNRDIYFVANQKDRPEDVQTSFRVEGKEAELWHPDTGLTEPAEYNIENGRTSVPLHLDPGGSVFVVFQHVHLGTISNPAAPRTDEPCDLARVMASEFPPELGRAPTGAF